MGPVLHADLAEVSSTDIIKRGFGPYLEITGSGDSVLRQCGTSFILRGARHFLLAALVMFLALGSFAAPKASKSKGVSIEVARALQITRGKQIDSGLVFLDGKFLPPPYVVERYGNALRINGIQVTRALIPWGRFLMTQEGASVVTEESAAGQPVAEEKQTAAVAPEPKSEPKPQPKPKPAAKPTRAEVAAGNYLESLFDDDETEDECVIIDDNETDFGTLIPPKKQKAKPKVASKSTTEVPRAQQQPKSAEPPQPCVRKRVQFDGTFVMNAKCKQMVARMNKRRAQVDTVLRSGGFVFFSSKHAWTTGDGGVCTRLLAKLPELMKDTNSEQEFLSKAIAAGFNFIQEDDLRLFYKNRLDCFKLIQRRNELKEEAKRKALLKR